MNPKYRLSKALEETQILDNASIKEKVPENDKWFYTKVTLNQKLSTIVKFPSINETIYKLYGINTNIENEINLGYEVILGVAEDILTLPLASAYKKYT